MHHGKNMAEHYVVDEKNITQIKFKYPLEQNSRQIPYFKKWIASTKILETRNSNSKNCKMFYNDVAINL